MVWPSKMEKSEHPKMIPANRIMFKIFIWSDPKCRMTLAPQKIAPDNHCRSACLERVSNSFAVLDKTTDRHEKKRKIEFIVRPPRNDPEIQNWRSEIGSVRRIRSASILRVKTPFGMCDELYRSLSTKLTTDVLCSKYCNCRHTALRNY